MGRKLHCTMPRTNTPDNKSKQARYRRLGVRFGFICGLRLLGGGCANLSRLTSCEKTCQEFNLDAHTLRAQRPRPTKQVGRTGGEFGCAETCFSSRTNRRYK